MRFILAILFSFVAQFLFSQEELTPVKKFGSNPGDLRMFYHAPVPATEKAPLVVVLHGCTETADGCARLTGWNKFADENGFFVLYPEQKIMNNGETCFNWFYSGDQQKDKGEPASVLQMVAWMKAHFSIDTTKIFVSGLSAGAAMGAILMAVAPDVFNAGALFAGGAYKSAENVFGSIGAMKGKTEYTPQEWGDLVRAQNPGFVGTYPRLMIVQGRADSIVSPRNVNSLVAQWTNLHGCDQLADETDSEFNGNKRVSRDAYFNSKNETVVECFMIEGMGHAVPLDTGSCACEGGESGLWGKQVGFSGVYEAVKFFGIDKKMNSCIKCIPSIRVEETHEYPLVNHSANPALPDTIHITGTVVEIARGYCGVICIGGELKVRLDQPVAGYSDTCVYLVTACLPYGVNPGVKIDATVTAYYGNETECYYHSVVKGINSNGIPFYKLSEAETRKVH